MATEQEQKEALKKIHAHQDTIKSLTKEMVEIAEAAGVYFSFPAASYGMGGSYTPKSVFLEENKDDLDEEEIKSIMEQEEPDYDDGWGWRASSQSC